MRKINLTTFTALSLILIGTLTSCSSEVQPTEGFGIYLVEDGELILSTEHIKTYDKNTHEIELNTEGVTKWESYCSPKLSEGLYTKDFMVSVNSKELYQGKFWSGASSMSYAGVVIMDVLGVFDNKIRVEYGYPSPGNQGSDPRNNPEIISYFEKQGLLK